MHPKTHQFKLIEKKIPINWKLEKFNWICILIFPARNYLIWFNGDFFSSIHIQCYRSANVFAMQLLWNWKKRRPATSNELENSGSIKIVLHQNYGILIGFFDNEFFFVLSNWIVRWFGWELSLFSIDRACPFTIYQ